MRNGIFVLLLLLSLSRLAEAAEYDWVIRNGRIVDGTGAPAVHADIGIRNGRFARIGRIAGQGAKEFDAQGHIVAAGFIDVHTHSEDVAEMPLAENFARMGVTTIVTGNCGGSARDVAAFFQRLEATNAAINVATLVGHNTVRSHVMGGSFMRPPSAEELEKMKQLVRKAMEDGAVGLSTGLIYLPGAFAKTEEIIELAKVVSAFGGIYASHMREEGPGIAGALEELFRIAREANIRADISHLKLSGRSAWGKTNQVLKAIEQARAEGLDITHDQYVYTASSTGIAQLIPQEAREGGKLAERLKDPAQKREIIKDMKAQLARNGREDYEYTAIASYRRDKTLNGLRVPQAAKLKRGSDSLDDQIELILELETNGGASGVFHNMHEADLQVFVSHPNTMFASDSGVRKFGEGVPHPRGYGNNARVLARYVREFKLLRLEEAVRRMTSLPAITFGLKDRGLLSENYWADLVILDPAAIQDHATFEKPHQYPTGLLAVFVNGVPVFKDGQMTGARPGQPVRRRPE